MNLAVFSVSLLLQYHGYLREVDIYLDEMQDSIDTDPHEQGLAKASHAFDNFMVENESNCIYLQLLPSITLYRHSFPHSDLRKYVVQCYDITFDFFSYFFFSDTHQVNIYRCVMYCPCIKTLPWFLSFA